MFWVERHRESSMRGQLNFPQGEVETLIIFFNRDFLFRTLSSLCYDFVQKKDVSMYSLFYT